MKKIDFNQNWLFERVSAPVSEPKLVALPHDAMLWEPRDPHCANGKTTGFYPGGCYRYTKRFVTDSDWAGKTLELEFEGVYQNAVVFLNGKELVRQPYGYSNFSVALTGHLQNGENLLEVLVDNSGEPNTRWYSGSGIYRPVWLYLGGSNHIAIDGIEVTTLSCQPAVIRVCTRSSGGAARVIILRNGNCIASGQGAELKLEIPDAVLWSADTPELYTCEVQLAGEDGTIRDTASTSFGICHRSWSPKGLLINGIPTKLRGACIHSDNGVLGACEFPAAALRRAKILKEAGFNAIRSAHNPISRAMLDACDQVGLYVMDELCDMWYEHKNRYDYACHFEQWHTKDLTAMVRKDISHPCVVMYSIGNEVTETAEPSGIAYTQEMTDLCRRLDSTRPVTCGINMALNVMHFAGLGVYRPADGETVRPPEPKNPKALAMLTKIAGARQAQVSAKQGDTTNSGTNALGLSVQAGERKDGKLVGSEYFNEMMRTTKEQQRAVVTQPIAKILSEDAYAALDIAGYNYADGRYEQDAADYPERISVGTETLPQRIYRNWRMVEKLPYLVGDFMWTGWDYLGEAGVGAFCYDSVGSKDKDYPALLAGSGVIDITGQPRPEVWLNKAVFGLTKQPYIGVEPVTHAGENKLISAWRFSDAVRSWSWQGCEGRTAEIVVYADAAEVELLQDGHSVGRTPVCECQAHFTAVYTPGTLTAIAYDANGHEQGRDTLCSAAGELCLTVFADKARLNADGQDLCYLDILLTDRNGIVQAAQDRNIEVSVSGAATLAGLGSADPFNTQPYTGQTHQTYYGRLQAVMRAGTECGTAEVDITSGELHQRITLNIN